MRFRTALAHLLLALPATSQKTRKGCTKVLKFAASGALSYALTVGVTSALHELAGVTESAAAAGGLATAFTVNFAVLRLFVFGSSLPLARQFATFAASSAGFRLAEYGAFLGLHALQVQYLLALSLVLVVSFFAKFAVSSWIFRHA